MIDYPNVTENYVLIAIDLSNQQDFDADLRAIQQLNFARNLERTGNKSIFFIIKEVKETIQDFSEGTVKVFSLKYCILIHNMTQYHSVNVKLSNSQLNKLKSARKDAAKCNSKTIINQDWCQ